MNWTCQRAPQQEEKPTVRCVSTNVKPQLNAFTEDTHTHPPHTHTHTTCTHTLLRISTHVRDPPEQIVFHSLNTRSATCLGISWVPKHIVTKHLTLKQTNKQNKEENKPSQTNKWSLKDWLATKNTFPITRRAKAQSIDSYSKQENSTEVTA